MAKKLVLVPEDMYKGLMSSSRALRLSGSSSDSPVRKTGERRATARDGLREERFDCKKTRDKDDKIVHGFERFAPSSFRPKKTSETKEDRRDVDDGLINLEFTRKNMLKARDQRGKSKNVSAKNTAYYQELRRFLRFRKEIRDKPIRVKLSNGANIIVKGSNTGDDSKLESAILNDDGDLESTFATNPEPSKLFATSSAGKSAVRLQGSSNVGERREQSRYDNPFETPKFRLSSSRVKKKTPSELSFDDKKKILLNYLFANAESLGITQKGEVLRSMGGVPMKTSSLEAIVERLLDASRPGSSSPPGTNILRGRLGKDLKYKQLIIKLKEADQYGKGLTSSSLVAQNKFKPTKWSSSL